MNLTNMLKTKYIAYILNNFYFVKMLHAERSRQDCHMGRDALEYINAHAPSLSFSLFLGTCVCARLCRL